MFFIQTYQICAFLVDRSTACSPDDSIVPSPRIFDKKKKISFINFFTVFVLHNFIVFFSSLFNISFVLEIEVKRNCIFRMISLRRIRNFIYGYTCVCINFITKIV